MTRLMSKDSNGNRVQLDYDTNDKKYIELRFNYITRNETTGVETVYPVRAKRCGADDYPEGASELAETNK